MGSLSRKQVHAELIRNYSARPLQDALHNSWRAMRSSFALSASRTSSHFGGTDREAGQCRHTTDPLARSPPQRGHRKCQRLLPLGVENGQPASVGVHRLAGHDLIFARVEPVGGPIETPRSRQELPDGLPVMAHRPVNLCFDTNRFICRLLAGACSVAELKEASAGADANP